MYPAGQGAVDAAFQRAVAGKPPPKAAELYADKPALLLASLCRELQNNAGAHPFFLDCRIPADCSAFTTPPPGGC